MAVKISPIADVVNPTTNGQVNGATFLAIHLGQFLRRHRERCTVAAVFMVAHGQHLFLAHEQCHQGRVGVQTFACFETGKVTKKSHEKQAWSHTNWVISFEKGQLGEMQRITTKQPNGEAECKEQQQKTSEFARLAATHSGRLQVVQGWDGMVRKMVETCSKSDKDRSYSMIFSSENWSHDSLEGVPEIRVQPP
jgi:hypothetical protein